MDDAKIWGSGAVMLLFLASSAHVFLESWRNKVVGRPFMHTLMCAVVLWPLGYLCWLLWWPGTLRRALIRSLRDRH